MNKKQKQQEKQMAFWFYDSFPGLLCGTITKTLSDGRVETKEYGSGTAFKPCFILPYDQGITFKEKLEELKVGRLVAIQDVNIDWQNKLNDLKREFGLT